MSELLEPTPIRDVKPQLVCIGQLLGMDLYVDICNEHPDNYDIAQKVYQRMLKLISEAGDAVPSDNSNS